MAASSVRGHASHRFVRVAFFSQFIFSTSTY